MRTAGKAIETAKTPVGSHYMEKYHQILRLGDPTLIGLLGGTVICIKMGCSSPQYSVRVGRHVIGLGYSHLPQEAKPRQTQRQRRRVAGRSKGGSILAYVEEAREERREVEQEAAQASMDHRDVESQEPEEPDNTRAVEVDGKAADMVWRVVSAVAERTGHGVDVVKRVVDTLLEYLSIYPSVGVMRLAEDIYKYMQGRIAQEDFKALLSEALNALDIAGIVEVSELDVVNLKQRVKG